MGPDWPIIYCFSDCRVGAYQAALRPHFPTYNALRNLLAALDAGADRRRPRPWLEQSLDRPLGINADRKVLP